MCVLGTFPFGVDLSASFSLGQIVVEVGLKAASDTHSSQHFSESVSTGGAGLHASEYQTQIMDCHLSSSMFCKDATW